MSRVIKAAAYVGSGLLVASGLTFAAAPAFAATCSSSDVTVVVNYASAGGDGQYVACGTPGATYDAILESAGITASDPYLGTIDDLPAEPVKDHIWWVYEGTDWDGWDIDPVAGAEAGDVLGFYYATYNPFGDSPSNLANSLPDTPVDPEPEPEPEDPGTAPVNTSDVPRSACVAWASEVVNYTAGTNVNASFQTPANAVGSAGGLTVLGEGGSLTLKFDAPFTSIAAFENGFASGTGAYLELAYVDFSTNGQDWKRVPTTSLTSAPLGAFDTLNAALVDGFAGKSTQGTGLATSLVGLDSASYVRLTDVRGGTDKDSAGRTIYDPQGSVGSAGYDHTGTCATALASTDGGTTPVDPEEPVVEEPTGEEPASIDTENPAQAGLAATGGQYGWIGGVAGLAMLSLIAGATVLFTRARKNAAE